MRRKLLSLSLAIWGHSEKADIYKSVTDPSLESNDAEHWSWLSAPRTIINKYLLLHLSLFVYAGNYLNLLIYLFGCTFIYFLLLHTVQFSHSVVSDSVTPWTAACQASLSITNSRSLLKFMFIESVMPSNHLILCRPLVLPSIFPSIRVFSNESVLHIKWPKYWSFSFSVSPSNEYSGLIFFSMNWLDLLAV